MSCGVAVKRSLVKLYYKYLLFPYNYQTPAELIFITRPQNDEALKCYRVLNIPKNTNQKDVFDSCIYPQVPEEGTLTQLSNLWHGTVSLKSPGISHKLDFCAKAHLRQEYDSIKKCDIGNVFKICEKILSVHSCSSRAIKANIEKNYKERPFYDSNASQV